MAVVQEGSHGGLDGGRIGGKTGIHFGGSAVQASVNTAVRYGVSI